MEPAPIRVVLVDDDEADDHAGPGRFTDISSRKYRVDSVGDFDAALEHVRQAVHDVCFDRPLPWPSHGIGAAGARHPMPVGCRSFFWPSRRRTQYRERDMRRHYAWGGRVDHMRLGDERWMKHSVVYWLSTTTQRIAR
jgi:hypothetical protein